MANFFSKISSLISLAKKSELRDLTSAEFEAAVNAALLAATASDNTRRPAITPEGALNISAVWACVRILSETVGTLPVHLYERTASGREPALGHPCALLLAKPNAYTSRFALLHHLMVGVTLWGNGYARIYRDRLFRPVRLQFLHPYDCEPVLTPDDELFYRISPTGELLPAYDIIHLKGLSTNGYKGEVPDCRPPGEPLAHAVRTGLRGEVLHPRREHVRGLQVPQHPQTGVLQAS